MPSSITQRLEQIQGNILGGSPRGQKVRKEASLSKMGWYVCHRKRCLRDILCLSIRSFFFFVVCFGKWNKRSTIKRGAFWSQVIRGKYGVEEGVRCFRAYSVGIWKGSRKVSEFVWFRNTLFVGYEKWVKFWKDNWCM